jgi:hypothetical protein
MNYRDWTSRALSFARDLNKLPGQIQVTYQAAPPLTQQELIGIRQRWTRHLPGELIKLWAEGSSHLDCQYLWTPPPEELPELHKIFESESNVYGGPKFIPATEVDLEETDMSHFGDIVLDWTLQDSAQFKRLWTRAVIFLHIASGDCLGLDPQAPGCDADDPPVVYLSHDEPTSDQISPRFTDFLQQWQELCYIGPESWLFENWLDVDAKRISANRPMSQELRRLLTPR